MMNRKKEIEEQLGFLKLPFILEQHRNLAAEAASKNWSHQEYLQNLVQGEADLRWDHSSFHPASYPHGSFFGIQNS